MTRSHGAGGLPPSAGLAVVLCRSAAVESAAATEVRVPALAVEPPRVDLVGRRAGSSLR